MTDRFMGEYNHTLDAKGRLIVPAKFRENGGDKFVVTRGLDGCLFMFTTEKWDSVLTSMESLPVTQGKARKLARFMLGGACECEVDKQGRILIPNNLRNHASLEKDVVLVGVGSRVEIWSKESWEMTNVYDEIEDIAEDLEELRF